MSSPQVRFERRLKWHVLAVATPGVLLAMVLLWTGDHGSRERWTGVLFLLGSTLLAGVVLVNRVVFPLQTLANLLGGLREGDFSTRARGAVRDDALGEVLIEANALAETLREQRLGALEANALLRTVMEELDAAVFALDEQQRLRLANRAAESLLGRPVEQLLDRTATELGLAECFRGEMTGTLSLTFPGALGRFGVRRTSFRQAGRSHQLLVLNDLSRALRDEERQAWQRLVRVMGHEINNSLAPIKSLAGSLESLMDRQPLPEDWRQDMVHGLGVISARAESLTRFMEAYAKLAKLPPPRMATVELGRLLERLIALESRVAIRWDRNTTVELLADPDQLEQLLINLLRNATEATLEASSHGSESNASVGDIEVQIHRLANEVEILIIDSGPGLANPSNVFVPFFTTKPNGSGIGLTLSRQIAENHGGSLQLENRGQLPGCVARIRLPNR